MQLISTSFVLTLVAASVYGCAPSNGNGNGGRGGKGGKGSGGGGSLFYDSEAEAEYLHMLAGVPDLDPTQALKKLEDPVCERGSTEIDCGSDAVIQVINANYGRTQDCTVCPQFCNDGSARSCVNPKSQFVAAIYCSFERKCKLYANNRFFKGDPCKGTWKTMTVEWKCLPDVVLRAKACQGSFLTLKCPPGRVIKVLKGKYGRFEPCSQTCGHPPCIDLFNFPCSKGIGLDVQWQCNGLNTCRLPLRNSQFLSMPSVPCPGTLQHAEVKYKCVAYTDVYGHNKAMKKKIFSTRG